MAKKNNASECALYRLALKAIKKRVDLFGRVITPTAEEMRFMYTELQEIVNNALNYEPSEKN